MIGGHGDECDAAQRIHPVQPADGLFERVVLAHRFRFHLLLDRARLRTRLKGRTAFFAAASQQGGARLREKLPPHQDADHEGGQRDEEHGA